MGNDEFLDQDMTARKCAGDRQNMAMLTSLEKCNSIESYNCYVC